MILVLNLEQRPQLPQGIGYGGCESELDEYIFINWTKKNTNKHYFTTVRVVVKLVNSAPVASYSAPEFAAKGHGTLQH